MPGGICRELPSVPVIMHRLWVKFIEGALACAVRAVQTLGISGDPPGDNRNHQEASRKEQKLCRSLRDLLANHKTNGGRQALCLQLSFSRVLGCLGGCILGRCTGV